MKQKSDSWPFRAFNFRIAEWRDVDVVSLGVLADGSPGFRPMRCQRKRWGCELDFHFPVVKLLDWGDRWDEQENSGAGTSAPGKDVFVLGTPASDPREQGALWERL